MFLYVTIFVLTALVCVSDSLFQSLLLELIGELLKHSMMTVLLYRPAAIAAGGGRGNINERRKAGESERRQYGGAA